MKKNLEFSNDNKFIAIFSFLIFVIVLFYIFSYSNDEMTVLFLLGFSSALIVLFTICVLLAIKITKIEKLLFIYIMILGVIFSFLVPPFRVTDESVHYIRIFSIIEGNFSSQQEEEVSESLNQFLELIGDFSTEFLVNDYKNDPNKIIESKDIEINEGKMIFVENAASSYSPFNYMPQIVALLICKICNTSILFSIYLGRIFACLFYSVCICYSIKIIPCKKTPLAVFALNPMLIHQVAGYSSEAVNMSLIYLILALVVSCKYSKAEKISRKRIILLAVVMLLFGFAKPPYFLFSLLVLLIPKEKFCKHSTKYILVMLPVISFLLWQLMSNSIKEIITNSEVYSITYIIQNPIQSAFLVFYNMIIRFTDMIHQGLVGVFGGGHEMPKFFVIIPVYMLIVIILENRDKYLLNIKEILWIIFLIISVIGSILLVSMFWTNKNQIIFDGLQGRYFLPIIPSFIFLINIKNQNEYHNFETKATLIQMMISIPMFISIYESYYLR